ncbi:Transketolase, thiamine diphosphate binding domain-containing protein [Aspergillus recurvatus]
MPDDEHAVYTLRNLIFDICNQNGGGHGGSAIGMAAIGVASWKCIMRYNPSNPDWFDRDRFVLSNGHCAMFLYALNYLTGFDAWTMDELQGYGNAKENGFATIAHGHPEIKCPGVEVTTGPLGQGIANSVGLAIASKNLAAWFNRPGYKVVSSRVYCMMGHGCLMEGVVLEAIALAGHLQLDILINSEDINKKMRASGWHVLDVMDGCHNVQAICSLLKYTQSLKGKPTCINIGTIIGVGTSTARTAKAHHGSFDMESITKSKLAISQDPFQTHNPTARGLNYFQEQKQLGEALEQTSDFAFCLQGAKPDIRLILQDLDNRQFSKMSTKESNRFIFQHLWDAYPSLYGGGTDLVNSNKFLYSQPDIFYLSVSYQGCYIRYGIRGHAMAAISNRLAVYNPGTFLPVTAIFLMFYIYAAPGVRMGALSCLPTIHIATHDSFAEGQNGPTHQPVELDPLYWAMPNLTYIRPSDAEELIGAWMWVLESATSPTMISIARDPVDPVPTTSRYNVPKGAYVLEEYPDAQLTLVSCGTSLHHTIHAAKQLHDQSFIHCRIVSAPSCDLIDQQPDEYRDVEEYVATTWARYVTASVGMTSYGYSASNPSNYERFGLNSQESRLE